MSCPPVSPFLYLLLTHYHFLNSSFLGRYESVYANITNLTD